jgi:adenine-specific DNA-methyltransferase
MVELIWDGKYDADGKRVAPPRVALPFQTVETVNESAQQRQRMFDLFNQGRDPDWRNRLIWGDKKYVLPSLLPEFAGKVDLIYIDPPFATGADFSFATEVGDERFTKEASMIEQKAYRDTWGRGLDGYMHWLRDTIMILYELLSSSGWIYLHLDWHVTHYAKIILDEVFGVERFTNEIVWQKIRTRKGQSNGFGNVHDVLLSYTKSDQYSFTPQYTPHDLERAKTHYSQKDSEGRLFRLVSMTQTGSGRARRFGDRELSPPVGKHWVWSQERIDEAMDKGLIVFTSTGTPQIKRYLDEAPGLHVVDIWTDIFPLNAVATERLNYPTQKPEALLERIIKASSNEGDLVLDCFAGSGTTAAVAEKLGRRWITCDLGRFAVHTTRKRLLAIEGVRPFIVQNLGKYERQVWQQAQFGADAARQVAAYRHFILDLYHADPIAGYTWLHGKKAGRLVHVGTVDSPVALGDVQQAAIEFRQAIGTGADAPRSMGLDLLGWDFALDMNETAAQLAAEAGLDLRFVRIPREVLEAKAVEQGDIRFFELAALGVDVHTGKGRNLRLQLTDFMVPPDDVPQEVMAAVDHWSAWIDYWAVDFDHKNDTFHNMWQSYRTRRDRSLQLSIEHTYDAPGTYTVVVKVIDILGNDTTRTITVAVQ